MHNDEGLVEDEPKLRQDHMVDNSKVDETPRKNVMATHSSSCDKNRTSHEEWRLQIDELDEWQIHVKEQPKAHDESK
ncbi:hypothetical protein GOBAR_AA04922 [Gossypium barbadense]|uniref:Uncharacterized protein n=1 Tax=Gossypium barbadense TaxID=3634 RepID=A0A2P5YJ87_GOSBA|nr:hypothetical protein GOBAR_AA04922 [Gossypium barbadense]